MIVVPSSRHLVRPPRCTSEQPGATRADEANFDNLSMRIQNADLR
jgi:hypothetical protein